MANEPSWPVFRLPIILLLFPSCLFIFFFSLLAPYPHLLYFWFSSLIFSMSFSFLMSFRIVLRPFVELPDFSFESPQLLFISIIWQTPSAIHRPTVPINITTNTIIPLNPLPLSTSFKYIPLQ